MIRSPSVLHLVSAPVLGGAQQVLCTLVEDQLGHGLAVAAGTSPGGPLGPRLQKLGVPLLLTPLDRGLRPDAVLALRRFLGRTAAQILHAHGARATLYGCLATLGRRGAALVSHVHLADPWRFGRSARARLDRLASSRAARIVACSEQLRRLLVERQGLPASRTVCIPNGIDLGRFACGPKRVLDGRLVAGTCVRLEPQKGVAHLIEAVARLAGRLPELRLVVAGEGSLRPALERQAAEAGLAGRVDWLGFRPDVPQVLAGLDLFVLPSLAEGLPLSVIEAMAAGVPVIATDVPGSAELVQPGRTGRLVPPGSAEALAEAILDAAERPETSRLWAERARDLVRQRHSAEAMAAAVRRLYAELLSGL
jgi:glycosyltransferase involved in cell wall biosynthesis